MQVTELINSKADLNDVLTQRKAYAIIDGNLFIRISNESDANEVKAGFDSEATSPFHIGEFEQYNSIMLRIDAGVPVKRVESLFKDRISKNLSKLNIANDDKTTLDILMKIDEEFVNNILNDKDFCKDNDVLIRECLSDRGSGVFACAFNNVLRNYSTLVNDGSAFFAEETDILDLEEWSPRHNCIFYVSKESGHWYVDGARGKRPQLDGGRLEDYVTFDNTKHKVIHTAHALSIPIIGQYGQPINVRENTEYSVPCLTTRVVQLEVKDLG